MLSGYKTMVKITQNPQWMPTIGWRSFDEAKVAVSRFIRGYYSLLRPHEIIARIAGNDTNVPRRGNGSWLTSATQEQQPTVI